MSELVTTRERSDPYILLKPGYHPARVGPTFYQRLHVDDNINDLLDSIQQSRILALDFETKGGDFSSDISIVGVGLAWDTGSCYVNWENLVEAEKNVFLSSVAAHPGLIAHNVYFDGGVFKKVSDLNPKWHMCTYSLLAHLANEGVEGRHWGLKPAMVDLLGWQDSNDKYLRRWLVENGHVKKHLRTTTKDKLENNK